MHHKANPSDILLFHKRRQAESAKGGKAKKKRGAAGLDEPIEPEDLAEVNIGDLVAENLVKNDKKLELLDEKSMDEGEGSELTQGFVSCFGKILSTNDFRHSPGSVRREEEHKGYRRDGC